MALGRRREERERGVTSSRGSRCSGVLGSPPQNVAIGLTGLPDATDRRTGHTPARCNVGPLASPPRVTNGRWSRRRLSVWPTCSACESNVAGIDRDRELRGAGCSPRRSRRCVIRTPGVTVRGSPRRRPGGPLPTSLRPSRSARRQTGRRRRSPRSRRTGTRRLPGRSSSVSGTGGGQAGSSPVAAKVGGRHRARVGGGDVAGVGAATTGSVRQRLSWVAPVMVAARRSRPWPAVVAGRAVAAGTVRVALCGAARGFVGPSSGRRRGR